MWHDKNMPNPVKQKPASKGRSTDVNKAAHQLVDLSTRRVENGTPAQRAPIPKSISQYMAEIGRKGGQIGGKQRLTTMSADERTRVAQKAAKARWERRDELER